MSDPFANRPFPRAALLGAAGLIGFALLGVSTARVSGLGATQVSQTAAIESLDLRFLDRADGAILVYENDAEEPREVLEVGSDGFVRGVMRSVARERQRQGLGSGAPVRLTLSEAGYLALHDPQTGYQVDLNAFGPSNADAFVRFFEAPSGTN